MWWNLWNKELWLLLIFFIFLILMNSHSENFKTLLDLVGKIEKDDKNNRRKSILENK